MLRHCCSEAAEKSAAGVAVCAQRLRRAGIAHHLRHARIAGHVQPDRGDDQAQPEETNRDPGHVSDPRASGRPIPARNHTPRPAKSKPRTAACRAAGPPWRASGIVGQSLATAPRRRLFNYLPADLWRTGPEAPRYSGAVIVFFNCEKFRSTPTITLGIFAGGSPRETPARGW